MHCYGVSKYQQLTSYELTIWRSTKVASRHESCWRSMPTVIESWLEVEDLRSFSSVFVLRILGGFSRVLLPACL